MCYPFKVIQATHGVISRSNTVQLKLTDWPCTESPVKSVSEGVCFWGMKKITDYIAPADAAMSLTIPN